MATAKEAREWARGASDRRTVAQLGTAGYLFETPERRRFTEYWNASVLGLPVGSYPESHPPQAVLAEAAKAQIRGAYNGLGLLED